MFYCHERPNGLFMTDESTEWHLKGNAHGGERNHIVEYLSSSGSENEELKMCALTAKQ